MLQGTTTTESYSYDPVGNRTASLGVASYTTNTSNEMTANSNASYTYDANGNTLTKVVGSNTTSYAWDYENRLTSVTLPGSSGTVTFKYDPFGRRIQKVYTTGANPPTSTTTNYLYDGDNAIETVDQNGSVLAKYTQGQNIDEPLAELAAGASNFYEEDGLGSVTSLTNSSGALALSYTYDSFGKITASSGSVTNPFRYTGRDFDTETGLYYYRARYYDSQVGRFISEDPINFDGGEDFYRYVENNPVELIDAWGLQAKVKPIPTPTPPEPTPPGPELVPDTPEPDTPFCLEFPLVCVVGVVLLNPMDLNPNEPNPGDKWAKRTIPQPKCPSRGCACVCRADADETMPGNIKPGRPLFRYGAAWAPNCPEASKLAKRIATRNLGMKPKHIPCECAGK